MLFHSRQVSGLRITQIPSPPSTYCFRSFSLSAMPWVSLVSMGSMGRVGSVGSPVRITFHTSHTPRTLHTCPSPRQQLRHPVVDHRGEEALGEAVDQRLAAFVADVVGRH